MSVIEAEVDVDETDIPQVKLGQVAKITIDAVPDATPARSPRSATARFRRRQEQQASSSQATNFKVVVTVDSEIRTCARASVYAEITTATRANVLALPIRRDRARDGRGRQGDRPHADVEAAAARRRRAGLGAAAGPVARAGGVRRARRRGVFSVKTGIAGEKYLRPCPA